MTKISYKSRIIVPKSDCKLEEDKRYLIPFIQGLKIGFVDKQGEIVIPPKYDIVLDDFYHKKSIVRIGERYGVAYERKTTAPAVYLYERYGLLNSNGDFIVPMEYEGIAMPIFSNRITIRSLSKGYAVVDFNGKIIVPFGKYSYIDGFDSGCARVKNGRITNGANDNDCQWGIIDEEGTELLPTEYSNIWNFYDKAREFTHVEKGTEVFEFHFKDMKLHEDGHSRYLKNKIIREMEDYEALQRYREETYDEYNGSYAQDVMGYSDQTIDDAFDGDPEAYWNID